MCFHVDVPVRVFFPGLNETLATQVVQGTKAVGVSKHRLRLESSPFFKRDFQWAVSCWNFGLEFRRTYVLLG